MAEGNAPDSPTLADQVSKLYDLVAGYHVTHLVEIARELGVWDALTRNPGRISSELAETLGVDAFYTDVLCRTAFSLACWIATATAGGWRHISTRSSETLSRASTSPMHHGRTWR